MSDTRPALLFDLDGTLVDTIALLLGSMRHAFDSLGIPRPTDAAWTAGIGTPLRTQFRDFVSDEAIIPRLVTAYRAYQHEHHDQLTTAYEGIPALVARLEERGHPIGIVTSKADYLAERALTWVGLIGHVDVVVGADSVARHKPHPEPVHVALTKLGAPHETAIFVGDSPHDVASGNAAGVRTVGVAWGAFDRAALAEAAFVVDSVAELEALLLRIA